MPRESWIAFAEFDVHERGAVDDEVGVFFVKQRTQSLIICDVERDRCLTSCCIEQYMAPAVRFSCDRRAEQSRTAEQERLHLGLVFARNRHVALTFRVTVRLPGVRITRVPQSGHASLLSVGAAWRSMPKYPHSPHKSEAF